MLEVALTHRFAGFTLDAAFAAPAGVTVLFGPSGSGKTSIANAVAGLLRPQAGRVMAAGTLLSDSATGLFLPPHRRRIGYVFQDARLFPHMDVRSNLLYGRRFAPPLPGGEAAAELNRVVGMLGIGALLTRRPADLSGGERGRVALGRAILSRPRLLVMDEPLAALDAARKSEILPYLERLRDGMGLPILYVTHAVDELARLASTVVVLQAGRIARAGPAAEVLADPDAAQHFGPREVGALLSARITGQEDDGLTALMTGAGPIWLPRIDAPPGTAVRLRVPARDVILALARPQGMSALNVLPGTVRAIRPGTGPGVLVQVMLGDAPVLARVTQRSAEGMGLRPGLPVFVVLKSLAAAPDSIAQPGG